MQLTDPLEVPVVVAAHRPQLAGPKRMSLPSRLPPLWVIDCDWSAPSAVSSGLPPCSAKVPSTAIASQMTTITASSTRACRLLPARWP